MENTIAIRLADINDGPVIHEMICKLEHTPFNKEIFLSLYHANLSSADNIYLLAEQDGKTVGYLGCQGQLLLHHMGMVYEIQELFVEDEHRNKGIGKLLIAHLEELLQKRPCELLEVSSNRKRADAHRFYERYGFAQSHLKFTK